MRQETPIICYGIILPGVNNNIEKKLNLLLMKWHHNTIIGYYIIVVTWKKLNNISSIFIISTYDKLTCQKRKCNHKTMKM